MTITLLIIAAALFVFVLAFSSYMLLVEPKRLMKYGMWGGFAVLINSVAIVAIVGTLMGALVSEEHNRTATFERGCYAHNGKILGQDDSTEFCVTKDSQEVDF